MLNENMIGHLDASGRPVYPERTVDGVLAQVHHNVLGLGDGFFVMFVHQMDSKRAEAILAEWRRMNKAPSEDLPRAKPKKDVNDTP